MIRKKIVMVGEGAYRCGEDHPKATISNEDVDLMRELHEEHGLTVSEIAAKWEKPKSTIRDIVNYKNRSCRVSASYQYMRSCRYDG